MLKNYFQLAFRSLRKNKTFSFINIFGLAIGLCSCLLILAFVTDELSYDRYPDQPGDIYRVGIKLSQNGGNADYPDPDVAVGPGMKNTYPEVLQFTRLKNEGPEILSLGVRRFKEQHLAICDSNFLQFFSIPLIEGDQNTALVAPLSMVISREMAKRYFGSEDPLGKTISAPNRLYKITGVFDNIPDNRHFHFDAFISTQTDQWIAQTHTWSNIGFYTYLMMRKGTDSKKLEARFPELVRKYIVPEVQHDMGVSQAEAEKSINSWHFYLMPVSDIHLKSHTKYELEGNGDLQYVYIFGALAIFIVLLACVNFTNLATAGATRRSREVGIRKVLGSLKNQLISQFLTESIFQTACAMILAFGFVWLLLPAFNLLSGKHISILFFFQPRSILILIGLILAVGILAGIYPAFFLSSFHIIQVLKGSSTGYGSKKQALRSGLVVFQFMISTALMIGTIIVYKQLYYMQNKKLGFDRSQVLQIQDTWGLGPNQDAFKQQLLRDSRVSHVTISRDVPVDLSGGTYDGSEVYAKDKGANESDAEIHSNFFHVDYDYLSTLGMKIVAGRNFSRDFSGDSSSVVINESAVRDLGWKSNEDALDKIIISSGQHRYTVIGVVQDFNYASAKLKIAPVMMMLGRNYGSVIV
ncbi:MAG TPA: ABC transporter permease, partial [Puia sp.]|nr:ABC transporter permease [Puia sp.]